MKANEQRREQTGNKSEILTGVGALVAAVFASACCWLPLLLVMLGASGGTLAAFFGILRPVLLPVTFLLLGAAFYFTYRKPSRVSGRLPVVGEGLCTTCGGEENAEDCCGTVEGHGFSRHTMNKVMLWGVTVLVLGFAFFPQYVGLFLSEEGTVTLASTGNTVSWSMAIEGMTCAGCAAHVRARLLEVPGVSNVNVDYTRGTAMLDAASDVDEAALRHAVEAAGYSVKSVTTGRDK